MTTKNEPTWSELAFDSWMLAGEMSVVVWLRSVRLLSGGKLAEREAERMISEKIAANAAFLPALMAGGARQSARDMAAFTLDYYGKPIRANRRRLTR